MCFETKTNTIRRLVGGVSKTAGWKVREYALTLIQKLVSQAEVETGIETKLFKGRDREKSYLRLNRKKLGIEQSKDQKVFSTKEKPSR